MVYNKFLEMIEQNDYITIYSYFTKELKKKISKRELKKVMNSYLLFASNHDCYVAFGDSENGENVWLDKIGNYGILIQITKGEISGLIFKSLYYFKEIISQLKYQLPFLDEWFVYWGGDNELYNYHYPFETQRYAYDFIKVDKASGVSYANFGKQCSDYYAFNSEVCAPLNGIVVDTKSNIKDNKLGKTNKKNPLGNYVIIKHNENEYSIIGHLKKNSIEVNIGDEITEKQIVGRCGNSGNSSEPHIHFQISNKPNLYSSQSLKINFENKQEPIKGETVRR